MRVKITKIENCESPKVDPVLSLIKKDYWIEGRLIHPIEVGKPVVVERFIRNGENVYGIFITSDVSEFNEDRFYTSNSIYSIEYLE